MLNVHNIFKTQTVLQNQTHALITHKNNTQVTTLRFQI